MYNNIKWGTFLKDVLICSLGAYGGPEAHYGVFTDQMVVKKQYLTEDELVELIALTGILPGPSSTQTIVAIGYKVGGPWLAALTMLVWGLPAILIMTALSFLYQILSNNQLDTNGLRFIGPMAVGFIAVASYRIGRKVIKNPLTLGLFISAMVITYFLRQFWVFPLVLVVGGLTTMFVSREPGMWHHIKLKPPYRFLIAFIVFAVGSVILNLIFDNRILYLFQSFYRYGYLVIGGGQVVIPYMFTDLVEVYQYMTTDQFLTGFGLVQGIPGPMFSFSAYAGGLASSDLGIAMQILGGLVSGIGIFLPGILLIMFVYPVWAQIRTIKGIKLALSGVTAVAGGLIAIAAVILMQSSGFRLENVIVLILTVGLLLSKKIPAPIIVFLCLVAGFII